MSESLTELSSFSLMMEEVELCFPQLNTSCWKPKRSLSHTVLIYIVMSFISLLTVTLNLLVIISISHFKQLQTPTNLLLLSLAVSDFFVGLLMLFQILLVDGCWYLGDIMCIFYYVLDGIITSASIGTMVLISIDRYVAICDPLRYPTKVNRKRVQVCICLCWMCSALIHNLMMNDGLKQPGRYNSCSGECVFVIHFVAGHVDLFVSFIAPVTIIIVLYMRVFVVAVSQARAMRSHIVTITRSVSVTAKKSELKAARTLGVVVIAFLICFCPYFCVTLTDQDTLLSVSFAAFVTCWFYLNSSLNPVIYTLFYPWFRKCLKLIVTLKILHLDSCEANVT